MNGEDVGMGNNERAAMWRFMAAMLEREAARARMYAAAEEATEAFNKLGAALQAGCDADLAQHPDMAELNVQMDALYGPTP